VILFPIYAVLVWALAWRWRRSWLGYVAVLMGLLGVGLLGLLYRFSVMVYPAYLEGPIFPLLLATEAVTVLVVGTFIVCLPRHRVDRPCRRCRYELSGLEEENPTCPECGIAHAARKVRPRRCRRCASVLYAARGDNPPCPACGLMHALREVRPEKPGVIWPAVVSVVRAVFYPRMSRYTTPNASTAKGRPIIMVIRNPDNTFTSIG
jgi:hypothetical protein